MANEEQKYRNYRLRQQRQNDRRMVKRHYEKANKAFRAAVQANPDLLTAVLAIRVIAELAGYYAPRHPHDYY